MLALALVCQVRRADGDCLREQESWTVTRYFENTVHEKIRVKTKVNG